MNRRYWSASLAGVLVIAGCQPRPHDNLANPAAPAWNGPATLSAQPSNSIGRREQSVPQPAGELSLPEVLALAVAHHPRLEAYAAATRAAEARTSQSGRWFNPEVAVEVENIGGSGAFSGVGNAETTLSLAQTFPLGGDIARRRELTEIQARQANWEYESARLGVLLEATQRFVLAVAADRRIELAERELELAQAIQRLTVQRVEAGEASPVEKPRAIVPVITAEIALQRARREQSSAYQRLAMTWGGREVTFQHVRARLDALDPLPSPQQLVRLINGNPQVAQWATRISAHRAEQRLAEAEAVPDLTARIGIKHHHQEGDVSLVVGISLPLPLFDRRQGDVLAARWEATAAHRQQRDAELRLESMLSAAYADLAGAHDQVVALRDKALPAAAEALHATRQAFEEGELPFLDVLDAQRTLFELHRQHIDALVAYHTAAAEIESLIARPLIELTDPPLLQEARP